MTAYRGGFEDIDDEDSCMSCLDTTKYRCLRCKFSLCNKGLLQKKTKKFQIGNLESLLHIVCLARKKPSNKAHSTQHTLSDAFAVSGLKAPFHRFVHDGTCFILSPRVLIIYA